jgi:lipopolysaccharide/colanic/teichoic acid biosynthesis glycosyltransferase
MMKLMQNRHRKVGGLGDWGVSLRSGKKPSALLNCIPMRREDILEEKAFRSMLALERRRAERSRQPFILMLFDARSLEKNQKAGDFNERLPSVVSNAVRVSDLIGWYQQNGILGVIFTEINVSENCSITEILNSKIAVTLRENFGPTLVSKLVVTVYLYPESGDKRGTDDVKDVEPYHDVSGNVPRRRFPMVIKRGVDIAGSAALLLILFPVFAVISVAIKLTSKGPVIFKQERLGERARRFRCLKFRTMFAGNDPKIHRDYVQGFIAGKVTSEEEKSDLFGAVAYKIKDDPRVTSIGWFLRRMSLDELPQFWNVLRGEMSLVGPRPPLPYEFEAYDLWHRRRIFEVKPGVTGLWQVEGRSRTSFDDMVRMDLRYCQRWSLWLDFKILLATPLAVFTGSGAY